MNIYSLPIPVANANGVKAFSEYGISKILETLTLGKNRMCGWMDVESRKFLSFLIHHPDEYLFIADTRCEC